MSKSGFIPSKSLVIAIEVFEIFRSTGCTLQRDPHVDRDDQSGFVFNGMLFGTGGQVIESMWSAVGREDDVDGTVLRDEVKRVVLSSVLDRCSWEPGSG